MNYFLKSVAILLTCALTSVGTFAHECPVGNGKPSPFEEFIGEPIEVQSWERSDSTEGYYVKSARYIFKVESVIKGRKDRKFAVVEMTLEGAFAMELNKRYHVRTWDYSEYGFASLVNSCTNTRQLAPKLKKKAGKRRAG
jgi:hypothetical protein